MLFRSLHDWSSSCLSMCFFSVLSIRSDLSGCNVSAAILYHLYNVVLSFLFLFWLEQLRYSAVSSGLLKTWTTGGWSSSPPPSPELPQVLPRFDPPHPRRISTSSRCFRRNEEGSMQAPVEGPPGLLRISVHPNLMRRQGPCTATSLPRVRSQRPVPGPANMCFRGGLGWRPKVAKLVRAAMYGLYRNRRKRSWRDL